MTSKVDKWSNGILQLWPTEPKPASQLKSLQSLKFEQNLKSFAPSACLLIFVTSLKILTTKCVDENLRFVWNVWSAFSEDTIMNI